MKMGSLAAALTAPVLCFAPLAVRAADTIRGEAVFQERCSMCHLDDGQGQAPTLKGVVGRGAASVANFPYTDALKASKLTWTPETLDRFLAAPGALVPGSAMVVDVSDGLERADLIAYLASRR